MQQYLDSINLDIVNAYINTFKSIHDKWDKAARKINKDDVSMYVDNMLIILLQDIKNAGYDGYFCPELKSREVDSSIGSLSYVSTSFMENAKKVDTLAIISPDAVQQIFQCNSYDFQQFAAVIPDKQKATKNSLKDVINLMESYKEAVGYASSRWKYKSPGSIAGSFASSLRD